MPQPSNVHYFNSLVYASANEDTRSELKALSLTTQDRVLCLTGSGARPLELLLGGPGSIVSIDLNPAQNHLLRLKIAAMKLLSYREYLTFLGIHDGQSPVDRIATFERLKSHLTPESINFWHHHREAIGRGVIYAGLWERNLQALARLGSLRAAAISGLLTCSTVTEQRRIWDKAWDGLGWRMILRVAACRPLWRHLAKEPGIDRIPKSFDLYRYLYESFDAAANQILFAEAPFLHLLLKGRYDPHILPLHLQLMHYETIRANLHRIEIVTLSLDDFLNESTNTGQFTAFSLSDFSTYCAPDDHARIWRGIMNAAGTNAKVCERQLFVKLDPRLVDGVRLERDPALEEALRRCDETVFYTFVCGTIPPEGNPKR